MAEKKMGLSVRTKLLISYLAITFFVIVVGIVSAMSIWKVYDNGAEIYANKLQAIQCLHSINQNVKEEDHYVVCMMTALDDTYHQSYLNSIDKLQKENENLMESYEKLQVSSLEKRRYNQCRLSILSFNKRIDDILSYVQDGETEQALSSYEQEITPVRACTYELLEAVVELSEQSAKQTNDENYRIYRNLFWVIIIMVLLGTVTAVLISVLMSRYFMNKLNAIKRYAKRISEYNVTTDIASMGEDEFAQTIEALNDSQFMIRELLEKIIKQSSSISDAGDDVSMAIHKADQRIEETNVQIYNTNMLAKEIEEAVKSIAKEKELSKVQARTIKNLLKELEKMRDNMQGVQTELSSLAMYIEQIGITVDYQNEMAKDHRQQVQKFRV